jgi:hypothetical protein
MAVNDRSESRLFGSGNAAAERHGSFSAKRWRPLSEQLAAEMLDHAPWVRRPAFSAAVTAWAAAEAKARLADDYTDEHGLFNAKGVPRPATLLADRLHARADTLRRELGLSPASFSRLIATFAAAPGSEAAEALEQLKAEGRAALAARNLHVVTTEVDG